MMNDVTIIIKTFLRDEYFFSYVESIRRKYPDIQILVADDGHDSIKKRLFVRKNCNGYYRMKFDSGLPAGRNLLVKKVTTPYIVIGDDDFFYTSNTDLDKMRKLMDIADIAGGAVEKDKVLQHYEGFITNNGDHFKYTPLELTDWKEHNGVHYKECDIVFNFAMFKKEVFDKVLWDERIKVIYEHSDFFIRAKLAGIKTVYTPESVVEHRHPNAGVITDEYRQFRLRQCDRDLFFRKYGVDYVIDMQGKLMTRTEPEFKP